MDGRQRKYIGCTGDVTKLSMSAELHSNWSSPAENESMAAKQKSLREKLNSPRRISLILFMVLAGAAVFYYAALSPQDFGRVHDDSIYVTTAKSLATGQGYRIISLPYEPAQTKYPPLHPFLLSLIWRAYPQFPQNLVPMMILTIAATLGFLAVSYQYMVKFGYASSWQAVVVVILAVVNWRTLVMATSLYSEAVYALVSVVALYLAEKYEQQDKHHVTGVLTGVAIGLTYLTRSVGVTLLITLALNFALRKQWKKALIPVAVASLFVVGWALWCRANKTTAEGINVAYYTNYFDHINYVIHSLQDQNNMSKAGVLLYLLSRNAFIFTLVSPMVVILGVDFTLAQYFGFVTLFILAGFVRQIRTRLRLLHIYIILYLAMNAFVPFPSYDRYLIPLIPFVLMFVVAEAGRLVILIRNELTKNGQLIKQVSAALIGLALSISAGTVLYNQSSEIYGRVRTASLQKTAKPAPEDVEAIAWINEHTDPSDVLVCYHDPVYFLFTGRRIARSLPMREWIDWREDKVPVATIEELFFRVVNEDNGRYLVVTSTDYDIEDQTGQYRAIRDGIIGRHPETFIPVFFSGDGLSKIFRVENR